MIKIRQPEQIYQAGDRIENGSFHGRWHFSFDRYYDPEYEHFGTLRVFNDDTLSPGAIWPLHPHRDNEVVTYCAEGEFRHADEHGVGGILKKGWVQHTTVGTGMWHSEINNLPDSPMRFIQMWFIPSKHGLNPAVQQRKVLKSERTNLFLPLVSNTHPGALHIVSDAAVFSSFLQSGKQAVHPIAKGRGIYLYVLEGGPVYANENLMDALSAAKITEERELTVRAGKDAELLLVDVPLAG